jgi:aminomethyltransferase
VTSGNFSPTLGQGIGMGYLSPPVPADAPIEVEIRGRWVPVTRVDPPFIPPFNER